MVVKEATTDSHIGSAKLKQKDRATHQAVEVTLPVGLEGRASNLRVLFSCFKI